MKHILRIVFGIVSWGSILLPQAIAAEGVQGITAEATPGAIIVTWEEFADPVEHYNVTYARESIIGNEHVSIEQESTVSDETALTFLDLENRDLKEGDQIFISLSAVLADGSETPFVEEQRVTVVFEPPAPPPQLERAGIVQASSEDETTVVVTLSRPITIPAGHPSNFFSIIEEETGNPIGVIALSTQGATVTLRTLPMMPRKRYTILATGLSLDPGQSQAMFVARGKNVPDTIPPEDPSNLTLERHLQENNFYAVRAAWQPSADTKGDLKNYNVYESGDEGETFLGPNALEATVTTVALTDVPPGTLTVKVTAEDESGNESSGIKKTITLPQTGAAASFLLSLGGAAILVRRRIRR